ncbi:MAG: serine/threonine dehydratase [Melioribacteraceae bacterium]|nr:serine/threonine dehydratase [Melioribacteraceae bacterium]
MTNLTLKNIEEAKNRIDKYINKTPILSSKILNARLGHEIYFKAEPLQKTGAFKIRGGINSVALLIENGNIPKQIIANSSGNHAQAVSLASSLFGIPATIYMPQNVSKVKAQATLSYGANIDYSDDRIIADQKVLDKSKEEGIYWIPPYNYNPVICGQGTAAYEALKELNDINAVFAPCGGGGLLSGTFIATKGLSLKTKVFGVEPQLANDATQSFRSGSIFKLKTPPNTIADGARTMSVGDITFGYLQQLDDFYEAQEDGIIYWTQWLTHLLKIHIEPTSAMAMVGVAKWLKSQKSKQRVLVILSGGNIDKDTMNKIWEKDLLTDLLPTI